VARAPLDRLRALCLALPETTERLSHGEPSWLVRDKKQRGSGVSLDVPVDWDDVADIVEDAYRAVAPKRLVAALDQHE
jgi:hypothetical protein